MKTTTKVVMSLLAAVMLVTWVSAHDNDHDNDGGYGGGLRGRLREFLENIAGGGKEPIWDFTTANGLPAVWAPFAGTPRFARYPASAAADQQAVLDRSTGLVWQRVPSASGAAWSNSVNFCTRSTLIAQGWRLPGIHELNTMMGAAGNAPFETVSKTVAYWSATNYTTDSTMAFGIFFDSGQSLPAPKTQVSPAVRYWCVRGGEGGQIVP